MAALTCLELKSGDAKGLGPVVVRSGLMLLEALTQQQPETASGHTTLVLAGCVGARRDQGNLGHSLPSVSRRSDQYGVGHFQNSADIVVYSVSLRTRPRDAAA